MTTAKLEENQRLSQEIAHYDKALVELESEEKKASIPLKMQAEYADAVNDLRQTLTEIRDKRKAGMRKLEQEVKAFFDGIDDPLTKAIFVERFKNGKQWWDVVDAIADYGRYSVDSVKMRCSRYLRKSEAKAGAETDA